MAIRCLNVNIFIEGDSEEAAMANAMERGAESALSAFPEGEIIGVDIESARTLDDAEISERGFEE